MMMVMHNDMSINVFFKHHWTVQLLACPKIKSSIDCFCPSGQSTLFVNIEFADWLLTKDIIISDI